MKNDLIIVAAAQFAPYFLDRNKTLEKAREIILTAGEKGAQLIVFPEAFISGYPDWVWLVPNGNSDLLDELYQTLVENAISIPDEGSRELCRAAKDAGVYVAMGIHERNSEASGSTLYNTLLYINDRGEIIGKHRKLIPTGGERLIWGQGDGSTLASFDTPFGKLGGLLCWENYMPLARQSMYSAGVQIYAAPTWDSSEKWVSSMRHIAREGGMFVINVCQAIHIDDIPEKYLFKQLYARDKTWINGGNSCIISPFGKMLAGPTKNEEKILYAKIDLGMITKAKRMFDVTGHYSRPDVFKYDINKG